MGDSSMPISLLRLLTRGFYCPLFSAPSSSISLVLEESEPLFFLQGLSTYAPRNLPADMRIPFKSGLRIGTDIADFTRFIKPLSKPGDGPMLLDWPHFFRLERKILRLRESSDMRFRFPWLPSYPVSTEGNFDLSSVAEHQVSRLRGYFAARFAAKEAAMKAWGADITTWQDLEVVRQKHDDQQERNDHTPYLSITIDSTMPRVRESTGQTIVQEGMLSIAHDGNFATAVVLAEELHPELRRGLEQSKARLGVEASRWKTIRSSEPNKENEDLGARTDSQGRQPTNQRHQRVQKR
jgi:phosphopantetheine--protein transferase-like protein